MNETIPQKSWWKRNWKWVVPTGGCLTLLIISGIFLATIFFGVTKMFKSATPYQEALTMAKSDTRVIQILGEPIETNGMAGGELKYTNDKGSADLSIPIKGPKGEATIFVLGEKPEDIWEYVKLEVHMNENDQVINLLDKQVKD